MIPYLGDFVEDDVVYLMFNTFSSDDPSASVTITNFINTDVHIHKDDSVDQRNNAAGITVSVNFDGITGSHMIKIDTNDDTVGGFWVTGHDYFVRIEGTTIDGATINAVVGHFSIQNRYMRGGLSPLATGTAQDGAVGSITLAAGATATNDLYNGARILITGGTGTEQSRIITAYDGTTKVASVAPNWVTTPNATSTYEIQAADSNVGAIQNDGQGATDLKDLVSGGLLQKIKSVVDGIMAAVS